MSRWPQGKAITQHPIQKIPGMLAANPVQWSCKMINTGNFNSCLFFLQSHPPVLMSFYSCLSLWLFHSGWLSSSSRRDIFLRGGDGT